MSYAPMTPERSSTGLYSGGEPIQARPLTSEQVAKIWKLVNQLEVDSSVHGERREKGSGKFRIVSGAGERGFIIKRSAPALAEWDQFLAGLRKP